MSLDSGDMVDAEPSRQGQLNFCSPGGKFLATGPVYCGAVSLGCPGCWPFWWPLARSVLRLKLRTCRTTAAGATAQSRRLARVTPLAPHRPPCQPSSGQVRRAAHSAGSQCGVTNAPFHLRAVPHAIPRPAVCGLCAPSPCPHSHSAVGSHVRLRNSS